MEIIQESDCFTFSPDRGIVEFDADGDINLLLDQNEDSGDFHKRFLVSSKALSLASPMFKAMFSGRYKEGTISKEIPLPDDNAFALWYLLHIAPQLPDGTCPCFD